MPKISIFIPIYNKEIYLKKSIKSIQRQSLKEIEIIAINDYSTDNSLNILKKIIKKDSRLKIINNDKNYGLLYSRAMGILNSKSEFIMNLDPDDELLGYHSLEYLYGIVKKSKVDIVAFSYLKNNSNISRCYYYNNILKQPIILKIAFNKKNDLEDCVIWNKLMRKKLLIKVYKIFKEKIYSVKWNYHEDNIWSILLHKYAKSMICIKNAIYNYKRTKIFGNLKHKKKRINIPYKKKLIKKNDNSLPNAGKTENKL